MPRHSISYPFPFSSFSLLQQGPGKGDTPKRILLREGNRLRASLLIRGSKAGPSEGFNSRLRARGFCAHYWSEVRRPAPRKGSTAASGYSGSAPTTDQGFVGVTPRISSWIFFFLYRSLNSGVTSLSYFFSLKPYLFPKTPSSIIIINPKSILFGLLHHAGPCISFVCGLNL
jgi:hypothetical protein